MHQAHGVIGLQNGAGGVWLGIWTLVLRVAADMAWAVVLRVGTAPPGMAVPSGDHLGFEQVRRVETDRLFAEASR